MQPLSTTLASKKNSKKEKHKGGLIHLKRSMANLYSSSSFSTLFETRSSFQFFTFFKFFFYSAVLKEPSHRSFKFACSSLFSLRTTTYQPWITTKFLNFIFEMKLKQKEDGMVNPFEQRSNNKLRHPALNRKVKGATRNVGAARKRAVEKREQVLLKEYKSRKSVSQVLDRRFGEKEHLTREEKMLKRFQTVRSKRRAGRFLLGDDADDYAQLTHEGKSISEVLDEDVDELDEEDSDEDISMKYSTYVTLNIYSFRIVKTIEIN